MARAKAESELPEAIYTDSHGQKEPGYRTGRGGHGQVDCVPQQHDQRGSRDEAANVFRPSELGQSISKDED